MAFDIILAHIPCMVPYRWMTISVYISMNFLCVVFGIIKCDFFPSLNPKFIIKQVMSD